MTKHLIQNMIINIRTTLCRNGVMVCFEMTQEQARPYLFPYASHSPHLSPGFPASWQKNTHRESYPPPHPQIVDLNLKYVTESENICPPRRTEDRGPRTQERGPRTQDPGPRTQGPGSRPQAPGSRTQDLGLRTEAQDRGSRPTASNLLRTPWLLTPWSS